MPKKEKSTQFTLVYVKPCYRSSSESQLLTMTDTNFFENFLTVTLSLAVQLVFFLCGPLTRRLLWLDGRVLCWQWKSFCHVTHQHALLTDFHFLTLLHYNQ